MYVYIKYIFNIITIIKYAAPENRTDFAVGGQRAGEGSGLGHTWVGRVGGLAVYDRALSAEEIFTLAKNTRMTKL